MNLHQVIFALEAFREFDKTNNRMPIQMFALFLMVASTEGISQADMRKKTKLSPAAVFRNMGTLEVKYGLVRGESDGPLKRMYLTKRGKELSERIQRVIL